MLIMVNSYTLIVISIINFSYIIEKYDVNMTEVNMEFNDTRNTILSESIMCGLISALISTALILVLAIISKYASLSDTLIKIINMAIKGVAVFVGVYTQIKTAEKGWLKGLLGGIIFTVVGITLYFCLGGQFSFLMLLLDLGTGIITGVLTGIMAVNKKNLN